MSRFIFYCFLLIVLFSACVTNRIKKTSTKIESAKQQLANANIKIVALEATSEQKLAEGKIDSTINALLISKIQKIKNKNDTIQQNITDLETLMGNKINFNLNYKKLVKPKLNLLNNFDRDTSSNQAKVIVMLEEGLQNSNFHLYDLAAFFGPGKYAIPLNKSELAVKSFSPMLDSIIAFSNKYASIPRTASLIVLGFADGQIFNTQNAATDSLKNMIGDRNANNQVLNQKLSELRAEEIINVLSLKFLQKVGEIKGFEQFKIDYVGRGKGEAYPLPYIKDYKTDDDRRRIVLCYWAVMPD